jgi:16S rRNA (cytosine967-C5)-methyltransferase
VDDTKKLLAELKLKQQWLGYSHPEWLVSRWQQRWGNERTAQLLDWNNTPPKTYGRVNTLKYSVTKDTPAELLCDKWRHEGVEAQVVRPRGPLAALLRVAR